MKVKPLKIKIKEPTPSAADRLYAKHQAIRKARGLPDPSEYKKKLDSMKNEEVEKLDEMFPTTVLPHPQKNKLDPKKQKSVDRDIKLLSKYKEKKLSVSGALDRLANFKKKHKVNEDTELDEGVLKTVKRITQGWGHDPIGVGSKPKDIVKRNKSYDVDTAKKLRSTLGDAKPHTPAGLQKRVLDRTLNKEETELDEGLKKAIGAVATAAAMATSPHAHSFVASPNIAVQYDNMKRDHERRSQQAAQQAKEKEGHEASMKKGQEFPLSSHDASKRAGNAAPLSDKSKKLLKKEAVNPKDMSNNPDNPEAGKFYSGYSKSVKKVTTIASPKNEEVKEPTGGLKKACWKGYTAVGMKMKGGRKVPNCVPIKEEDEMKADQMTTDNQKFPKKAKPSWDDMMNKETPKKSRKSEIVRSAAKKKMPPEDQFQAKPVLDSDVNPQTNKQ